MIPGELQGVKPEEPAEPETQPAVIPQLVLYILSDGTVTTEDPGGDARKFTVDLNDGGLKITQDEPAEPEKYSTWLAGTAGSGISDCSGSTGFFSGKSGDTLPS